MTSWRKVWRYQSGNWRRTDSTMPSRKGI